MMSRRDLLFKRMEELKLQAIDCQGCPGTCCTYVANSMLITPLEALEIYDYLKTSRLLTIELQLRLQETVRTYRLSPKFDGDKKSYLRKTYTCPFFHHTQLGCSLPLEVKPYGCLAFNSHHPELKESEYCYSEVKLLEEREKIHPEEEKKNQEIKISLKLSWEKAPIPNALLELWDT